MQVPVYSLGGEVVKNIEISIQSSIESLENHYLSSPGYEKETYKQLAVILLENIRKIYPRPISEYVDSLFI